MVNYKKNKKAWLLSTIFSTIVFVITFFALFGGLYLAKPFVLVTETEVENQTGYIIVKKSQEFKINLGLALYDNFLIKLENNNESLFVDFDNNYWGSVNKKDVNWTYNTKIMQLSKNDLLNKPELLYLKLDNQLNVIKKAFYDTKILIISSSILMAISLILFSISIIVYINVRKK